MARTPKSAPKGKKLNLATAEQADGALSSPRSAYEICGIADVKYREKTFAGYSARLHAMDLIELQDHAYELAVVPSPSAQVMIDRLEEKFLRENPVERAAVAKARAEAAERGESDSIERQAERIMARGR